MVKLIRDKLSRKPEYVKSVCIDTNIPFHIACGGWIIKKYSFKSNFYKNFTGQLSNLLFLVNPSEFSL